MPVGQEGGGSEKGFDVVVNQAENPKMRTGCGGSTFIFVDGVLYGPVGPTCGLDKNISLVADDVRRSVPKAEAEDIERARAAEIQQRAEASVDRQ